MFDSRGESPIPCGVPDVEVDGFGNALFEHGGSARGGVISAASCVASS